MTAAWAVAAGGTVMFLGIVGWAYWVTQQLTDAVDAARDTNDMQAEERDILRAWWEQLADEADARAVVEPVTGPLPQVRPVRTDTAEAAALITPRAVTRRRYELQDPRERDFVTDLNLAHGVAILEDRIVEWRRGNQSRTGATRWAP